MRNPVTQAPATGKMQGSIFTVSPDFGGGFRFVRVHGSKGSGFKDGDGRVEGWKDVRELTGSVYRLAGKSLFKNFEPDAANLRRCYEERSESAG